MSFVKLAIINITNKKLWDIYANSLKSQRETLTSNFNYVEFLYSLTTMKLYPVVEINSG